MRFGDQLKRHQYQEVWQQYCGFLELSMQDYMRIQHRLMEEQIRLWTASGVGQKILQGKRPQTVEDFRRTVPLTTYSDYADILLTKRADLLPGDPVIWLQTTWEGGKHPAKLAPYTRGMLDVFKSNLIAVSTLSSSGDDRVSRLSNGDRVLFGLAPLPYVTGLFPLVFDEEIDFKFLPPVKEANAMSFGQRNKRGFALGMQQGIDVFFGLSSVIHYITVNFAAMLQGGGSKLSKLLHISPQMLYRYVRAKYQSGKEKRPILPKDLFRLKALVCAGTDTASYKAELEEAWGVAPLEIFAGTEPSIVGTETWTHDGMVFFPDTCFYEFIPQDQLDLCKKDPAYTPGTVLMDELEEGHDYELVITVLKGGAFARYRVGDMFRCVGIGGDKSTRLPRLVFLDRISSVIDIAGFTRITETAIADVMALSGLPVAHWFARKEYDEERRPYLHLYLEMQPEALHVRASDRQLLIDHLTAYFSYFDSDYRDLHKMLGIDPLQITYLRCGAVEAYEKNTGKTVPPMNPSSYEMNVLLKSGPEARREEREAAK